MRIIFGVLVVVYLVSAQMDTDLGSMSIEDRRVDPVSSIDMSSIQITDDFSERLKSDKRFIIGRLWSLPYGVRVPAVKRLFDELRDDHAPVMTQSELASFVYDMYSIRNMSLLSIEEILRGVPPDAWQLMMYGGRVNLDLIESVLRKHRGKLGRISQREFQNFLELKLNNL